MIGLDTNVLVRYLVQDDLVQARQATRLIESQCTPDDPGWVNRIVLCELVWVLSRAYRYPRATIARTLAQLLQVPELAFEDEPAAAAALNVYAESRADFADALIGILNGEKGCRHTATFDSAASAVHGFRPVARSS